MAGEKDDSEAPRDTYIPKPPSKEEVDQISREQGMITDEWAGEPPAGGGAGTAGGASGPPGNEGKG